MKRLLLISLLLVFGGAVATTAPRTWKSSDGRFTTKAELLDFDDGKARLQKTDGKVIEVPLASLSVGDRDYVKSQFPGAEEEQVRPGAEFREWKSASGKHSTWAEYLGCSQDRVRLRKNDGTEIAVALKLLSAADRRWVADAQREEAATADDDADSVEVTGALEEQQISLNLVYLDAPNRKTARNKAGTLATYALNLTRPQQHFLQLGADTADDGREFRSIVTKEPAYQAPQPVRSVVRFGTHRYAFALDAHRPKSTSYDRLYFDSNGNGDLTDDEPIATTAVQTTANGSVSQTQFPRVNVTMDVDGAALDYAFLLSAFCRQSGNRGYATISIYSAAVRKGYIAQGGKRVQVLLIDRNSNGRFDDRAALQENGGLSVGDLVLFNPNFKDRTLTNATIGAGRNFVGQMVNIGRGFYQMTAPPCGDTLQLTPAQLALGYVTNPSPVYYATLFNEQYGILGITGKGNEKTPLPTGKWTVRGYTIEAAGSAAGARTNASATFGRTAPTISVTEATTTALPFGMPFHTEVTSQRLEKSGKVALSLRIVGAAGEHCTSFFVRGTRPPAPRFIIKAKNDEVVQRGVFEYG